MAALCTDSLHRRIGATMTTTVKIKNNGPDRINVNEVDRLPRDQERTASSHTLAVGEEIELRVWGANWYLCVLETDDTL